MRKILSLGALQIGKSAKILEIACSGELRRRLADMGLTPGTKIKIEKKAPFGDPIQIKLRGYHLGLRSLDAKTIKVEMDVK